MQLSSEKYAFPIDNSPDTILLTRLEDGLILDVNDGFSRNTGYARDEAIGKSTSELDIWVNRARRQVFVEVLKNRGECLNFESEFRAKDGRIVPSLVSAKLTEVDGEACVFSISRNISDLKLAEEKLRQSEAHFRTVVESLGEGVLITDKDDVVLYMNPRMTDLTGYTPEEMLGKPAYELLLPPEKWPTLQERNRQRATGVSERYEAQMLRKDRSLFWAEVYAAPYRNSDGEIVGTLGAMIDTTERKHLEEQLRQSQRMEALGQLTAGIAHNFNNVLQGIMGNLDIALMDAPDELKPSLLDAERTSRRGADIVRQLMLFTRSGGPAESQPVDINQVLGDTVAICRRTFDRRISITLETHASEATVIGDSGQLQLVFLNICLNARDALELLVDRAPAVAICVELQSDIEAVPKGCPREFLRIRIADNGPGMAKEIQPKVFEPFFTTKEVGKGTGLGLATAFGIVQQHGGSIDCGSKLEVGTTFTIRLPVVGTTATGADVDADSVSELAPTGSETILLVEDEMAVRTSVAAYLSRLGYTVLSASDGVEALAIYTQNARDIALVLLDVSLPGMSGRDLLRAIRGLNAEVEVIIFTGYSSEQNEFEEALPILHKPIDSKRVAVKIREVLDA